MNLHSHFKTALRFELTGNHIYVPVRAGDRDLWFLLDTGAGASMLDLETAKSLGLQLGQRFPIGGAGAGTTEGAVLAGATVELADDPSTTVPVRMAIDLQPLAAAEGRRAHGILGYDFIRQSVLEIDYHARTLQRHEPETFFYGGPGSRAPLRFENNHPHVDAELVLSDGAHITADFVVDIGSGLAVTITKPLVDAHDLRQRVGPTIHRPSGRGAGGLSFADVGRLARLRIGDVSIDSPIVTLYNENAGVFTSGQYFKGNIGADVLRRFKLILDYSRQELILEKGPDADEPFETDMSGALFVVDESATGFRVDQITEGTPAHDAGLTVDDIVTHVDDRAAMDVGLDAMVRLMSVESTVKLRIRRGVTQYDASLALRRMV